MVKISTKINIEINRNFRDEELESKISDFKPITRLFAKIKFNNLEFPEDAFVDTGAHISLIPFYIWKKLDAQIIAEHEMKGPIPEKTIPVNVGYVKATLLDEEGNMSKQIKFLSYLAFTNKVPLILGIRDLLEKFDLHILFSQNTGYLEESSFA